MNPSKEIPSFRASNTQTQANMMQTFVTDGNKSQGGETFKPSPKKTEAQNSAKKEKGGQKTEKQKNNLKYGIEAMTNMQDGTQRRGSFGHIINYANKLYDTKVPTLTEEEFRDEVEFKFGLPLICMDFIDKLIGSHLIEQIQNLLYPKKEVERFDTSSEAFKDLKKQVEEEFLVNIFSLFNALGAVDESVFDKSTPP